MITFYDFLKWVVIGPIVWLLCRFEVEGEENLPEILPDGKGYELTSNHLKWSDPVLLSIRWPARISFATKIELFQVPVLSWVLMKAEEIPLDRDKAGSRAVYEKFVEQANERMGRGIVFGLFPEGTRSRDGCLHEFKRGAVTIARATGRPIVPVGISYSRPWYKLRLTVHIIIGEPMVATGRNARELTKELERRIAALSGQTLATDKAEL